MRSRLFTIAGTLLLVAIALGSCHDDKTYADQKKDERKAVAAFIARDASIVSSDGDTLLHVGRINVITEEQFLAQDTVTSLERNEYVLFSNSGVYMQIVRRGAGERLLSGQSKRVIARYWEYNIMSDSLLTRNDVLYYSSSPDIIDISNSYGTFTASFNTDGGGGAMYRMYSSTEVPSGWLVPFSYIHIGRQLSADESIAKVRLIVPHSEGTVLARQSVYPCFYEITFQQVRE